MLNTLNVIYNKQKDLNFAPLRVLGRTSDSFAYVCYINPTFEMVDVNLLMELPINSHLLLNIVQSSSGIAVLIHFNKVYQP